MTTGKGPTLIDFIKEKDTFEPYNDERMKEAWKVAEGGVKRAVILNLSQESDVETMNLIMNTRLVITESAKWDDMGFMHVYIQYWYILPKPADPKAKADPAKVNEGFKADPASEESLRTKMSEESVEGEEKIPRSDESVDGELPGAVDQGDPMATAEKPPDGLIPGIPSVSDADRGPHDE